MLFQSKSSPGFFEERYRKQADPWNFAGSEYKQARLDCIAAALAHKRYHRAFEPGCSIGTLTERLATLCDQVDSSDFSPTAITYARQRCGHLPNVQLTVASLSRKTLLAGYDLIVISELGYYFRLARWRMLATKLALTADPGATILVSHWLGRSNDHRLESDQVHEVLRGEPLLELEHQERNAGFRLDRFVRL